jgi:hypothetical protein
MSGPEPVGPLALSVTERLQRLADAYAVPSAAAPSPAALAGEARARQLAAAEALGIPLRLRRELVGTEEAAAPAVADTPALAIVRAWLTEAWPHGECLVLCGQTGIGKTFAAAWGLLQAPPPGRTFVYFPALCAGLMDPDRRPAARALALHARTLVCDDFGAEYLKAAGSFLEGQIDEVIWTREAECRPTVFTTNLSLDALRARVSDRTYDRWRAWGRLYEVPGVSRRAARRAR